jgi:hypothetical protein
MYFPHLEKISLDNDNSTYFKTESDKWLKNLSINRMVTSDSIDFFQYKFHLYNNIQEDANLFVKIFAKIEGKIRKNFII